MITYLVRRLLLFAPTIVGATLIIFMIMFLSPNSVIDTLLPPTGEMQPGQRALREAYIEERYGLNDPPLKQYFRWANNISPVGFTPWSRDDGPVKEAAAREKELRDAERAKLTAQGVREPALGRAVSKIDLGPDPGEPRLNRPTVKKPDLGQSFIKSGRNWPIIAKALPVTIVLQAISLPIAVVLSLFLGIQAARHRGKLIDVGSGTVLLALYALPVIWVGVLLIGFLANVQYVKAFPTGELNSREAATMTFFPSLAAAGGAFRRGYLLDSLWHLVLPVVCVSYGVLAYYSKLTRSSLLETLSSDMVRTARAKGLPESAVLYRHALRNSLLPLITVAASFLPLLVTGSIVVETIFGLNGMGRLAIEALKGNDRELFLSVATMILLLQLVGNLLADLAYMVADPRVSYD